jgi:hypothetical protein
MRKISLTLLSAAALAGPAHGADFGMYATAGSVGVGGGLAAMFNSHLGARIGYTTFEYDVEDIEESDLTLDGEAKLGGAQALLDWHPFGGGFRLSVGAMESAELTARARPIADSYTFDGVTYSADDIGSATGAAEFDSVAPYVGLGYGRALSRDGRFAFALDLGVAVTGSPTVKLDVVCAVDSAAVCAGLDDDVVAEQAELQREADEFEYWPVLSLGVSYKF